MARRLRLHVPNGFHHVTLRGNHRQAIFRDEADRALLEAIVADAARELGARIHAYCWMTNHIHALVQVSEVPLGKLILRVASRYARRFQQSLATTGHLFERRHHAVLVDADSYLLTLVKYIHLNPVRAGLVRDARDYPWSSHNDYLGDRNTSWVCTSVALRLFSEDVRQARTRYAAWMGEVDGTRWGEGSLVPHPDHPQVLGNDGFLARLGLSTSGDRKSGSFAHLLVECARKFEVPADQIVSVSRSRALSDARAWLYREALARGVATVSSIARQCSRTESAIRGHLHRCADRRGK